MADGIWFGVLGVTFSESVETRWLVILSLIWPIFTFHWCPYVMTYGRISCFRCTGRDTVVLFCPLVELSWHHGYLTFQLLNENYKCWTNALTVIIIIRIVFSLFLPVPGIMFFCPMPPHVLVDFVVLPPEHGSGETDFWGWEDHEVQLRCPDDMNGDIRGWSAMRVLKPKFY